MCRGGQAGVVERRGALPNPNPTPTPTPTPNPNTLALPLSLPLSLPLALTLPLPLPLSLPLPLPLTQALKVLSARVLQAAPNDEAASDMRAMVLK